MHRATVDPMSRALWPLPVAAGFLAITNGGSYMKKRTLDLTSCGYRASGRTANRIRRLARPVGWLVALGLSTVIIPGAAADDMIDTIIHNVADNEQLYGDIEVRWTETYRKHYYHPVSKSKIPQSDRFEYRSVRQGGMFFLNKEGEIVGPPEKPETVREARRKGFDGEVTRWLEFRHGNVGNIVVGPAHDWHIMHAHTIPLRWRRTAVPLATYLRGRDAILAHPRGQESDVPQGLDLRATYLGEDSVGGLECHRIKIEEVRPTEAGKTRIQGHRILWLARDRNYLPVKAEAFNYFYSRDMAIETSSMTDLREIADGVWFPYQSEISVFAELALLEKKESILSWRREYLVTDVSLSPSYDVDFFRDVQFPDGTPVYEIKAGEIVRSFVQGEKPLSSTETPESAVRPSRWSRSQLVTLNVGCVVLLAAGLAWRIRSARGRPPEKK
jgi:hypothetical protein